MSKQYENDVAKEVWRGKPKYVKAYRAGYSGNNAFPQPDVHVFDNSTGTAHDLEIKGPIAGDTVAIEEGDDLEQLEACRSHLTRVYLVIKFQNRRPLVVPLIDTDETKDVESLAEQFRIIIENIAPYFNPRVHTSDKTGKTRLYLDKPSTDDFPSARASEDDFREILKGMGIYKNE